MDIANEKAEGVAAPTAFGTALNLNKLNSSTSKQIVCFDALRFEILCSLALLALPALAGVLPPRGETAGSKLANAELAALAQRHALEHGK